MDGSIRRKALRHAAKVAFGSLVVGCGGSVQATGGRDGATDVKASGDDAAADVATEDVVTDASSSNDVTTDAALACTGPLDIDASVDEQTFQCCLGVVEQVTGDAGNTLIDAGAVTGDPAVDNCCKAIIAHVDQNSSDYSAAQPTLQACCNALGYPTGIACTPWGPPMPPSIEELLS
jgi:hypothetical protein